MNIKNVLFSVVALCCGLSINASDFNQEHSEPEAEEGSMEETNSEEESGEGDANGEISGSQDNGSSPNEEGSSSDEDEIFYEDLSPEQEKFFSSSSQIASYLFCYGGRTPFRYLLPAVLEYYLKWFMDYAKEIDLVDFEQSKPVIDETNPRILRNEIRTLINYFKGEGRRHKDSNLALATLTEAYWQVDPLIAHVEKEALDIIGSHQRTSADGDRNRNFYKQYERNHFEILGKSAYGYAISSCNPAQAQR